MNLTAQIEPVQDKVWVIDTSSDLNFFPVIFW